MLVIMMKDIMQTLCKLKGLVNTTALYPTPSLGTGTRKEGEWDVLRSGLAGGRWL